MFTVREFKDPDFKEVEDIWIETGLSYPERGDNLESIKKTQKQGGIFYILEHSQNHKIVGTSWITNDGRRLFLHHFGIKPEFQGQKLSHLLMKATLNFARKLDMQIKLEVHVQNKIAENLYLKAGFKYLGDYKTYIIRDYSGISTYNSIL